MKKNLFLLSLLISILFISCNTKYDAAKDSCKDITNILDLRFSDTDFIRYNYSYVFNNSLLSRPSDTVKNISDDDCISVDLKDKPTGADRKDKIKYTIVITRTPKDASGGLKKESDTITRELDQYKDYDKGGKVILQHVYVSFHKGTLPGSITPPIKPEPQP